MVKMRDINAYVLKNPDALQTLYVELFGKYLMRYYDATGEYTVEFDPHIETSFMNSNEKRIVIALRNVVMLLQANVHVLAVAYHELAHVLYTSDRTRDQMRKKAGQLLIATGIVQDNRVYHYNNVDQQLHMLWNVIEDQRIERLIVKDFPFLADIIEPLSSVIQDDDKLMTWRRGKHSQRLANVPQKLIDLCEMYAGRKNFKAPTANEGADILAAIYELIFGKQTQVNQQQKVDYQQLQKYQPVQDDTQAQQPGQPTPDDQHGDDDNADEQNEGEQPSDSDDDSDELDDEQDATADADDDADDADDLDEDVADDDGDLDADDDNDDDVDGGEPALSQQELEQRDRDLAKAQAQDEQEKGILRMLKDIQQTQRENAELSSYKESVVEDHKPVDRPLPKHFEIPAILSIAQDVRNGMTAAQRKSYTSNISNRVSVPRLVETLSTKQEPKVFSNKGKDFTQLRKVVIFEDVSGSTHGTLSNIFSQLAYALAKSFNASEWWLYGGKLAKKHLKDYKWYSQYAGCDFYNVGTNTSSQSLLKVMRKYKDEKAIYVVITDGDIDQLIDDNIYKQFNDSTAIVGVLEDSVKSRAKHVVNMRDEIRDITHQQQKQYADFLDKLPDSEPNKYDVARAKRDQLEAEAERKFLSVINKSLQEVVSIVKSRLK